MEQAFFDYLWRTGCLCMCLCTHVLWAQAPNTPADSVRLLEEVRISAVHPREFRMGNTVTVLDSALLRRSSGSLADVLSASSLLFVRQSYPGGLATPALRGSTSSQMAVLWNGFNLQSVMNANLDLSQLPVALTEEVSLQSGGAGAVWGSGAVGGALHLSSGKAKFGSGLHGLLGAYVGSFGQEGQQMALRYGRTRQYFSLKAFRQHSRNDFPFANIAEFGQPVQRLANAAVSGQGIIADWQVRWRQQGIWKTSVWLQEADRQIPGTMTTARSQASQQEGFVRLSTEYQQHAQKGLWALRSFWSDERLRYQNPAIGLNDLSRWTNFIIEGEAKRTWHTFYTTSLSANLFHAAALHPAYRRTVTQQRGVLFGSLQADWMDKRLQVQLALRREWLDGVPAPWTPSASAQWRLYPQTIFRANVSRVYRVPTFNDRYWQPNGNPNLTAEQGSTFEAGLEQRIVRPMHTSSIKISAFGSDLEQMIQWLPDGTGFWQPRNIQAVQIRGIESSGEWQIRHHAFQAGLHGRYALTQSLYAAAADPHDPSIGHQLLYTPRIMAHAGGWIAWKRAVLRYTHQHTGQRNTTTDGSQRLPAFQIGTLRVEYTHRLDRHHLALHAQCQNLWDEPYQLVAFAPMPGRQFETGLRWEW